MLAKGERSHHRHHHHKLNILSYCDDVLVLNNGTVQAFGPRDQIVNRILREQRHRRRTVIAGALENKKTGEQR